MFEVFAVFDSKSASYGNLIVVPTKGIAIRSFSDVCANVESPVGKHPEDYSLFHIGTYDPNPGLLKAINPPVLVVSASSMVSIVKPEPSAQQVVKESLGL